jgi:hypothetical protein
MSKNYNQKQAANIRCFIERAERCIVEGKVTGAKNLLDGAKCALADFDSFRFRGAAWDKLRASYNEANEALSVKLSRPCDCWYCGFTAEQKQTVLETAEVKEKAFAGTWDNDESNFIGAYAEVIFGVKFHLPINLESSPDGGKDFQLHCEQMPSGLLTIDIKGTTYNEFRLRKQFIRRPDHIYVLIQVVEREHAFFRGFAFGNDDFEEHRKEFYEDQPGYKPTVVRPLPSLEELIRACQFRGSAEEVGV